MAAYPASSPHVASDHPQSGSPVNHMQCLYHHLETIEENVAGLARLDGVSSDRERTGLCYGANIADESNRQAFITGCNEVAALHALSPFVAECTTFLKLTDFLGLLIDTDCSVNSTGGLKQYQS